MKSNTFVISQDAKPLTIEIISQIFFGMPFGEAVHAVRNNKSGEFNSLYAEGDRSQSGAAQDGRV